jgi:hypothetical protein
MSAATGLDALWDPLSRCFDLESAMRIANFRIDPSVQERISALGELANEGSLSPDERDEYEGLIDAADFVSMLKLQVRRRIDTDAVL